MTELEYTPEQKYYESAIGTIGEFASPAGRIGFLQTKARLGTGGPDVERRLAEQILPFREVVPAQELKFGELLQRDIDDHRVARDLIPYLLRKREAGPVTFPPILCMMLPWKDPEPGTSFPPRVDVDLYRDEGLWWKGWRRGAAYQVEHLVTAQGGPYPMSVGRLSWNEEHARVVVLDGQHRAMAVLAIQRTIRRTWARSGAQRYQVFYERTVRRLQEEMGDFDLDDIEVPVTIAWLVDEDGEAGPMPAARQLFVDVNRSARQPSASRLTLLSETELLSIFARELLEHVRLAPEGDMLPLAAIEYDNPQRDTHRPVKWSVLTNLEFIKHAIRRSVFGPRELVEQISTRWPTGRQPQARMDRFMREQLELGETLLGDGEQVIAWEEIGNDSFPRAALDRLKDLFQESWGAAIITLLGELEPYAAHHRALRALREEWKPDDQLGRLAFGAIFEGVGLFWTLRSENDVWVRGGRNPDDRTEVIDAWNVLEDHRAQFEALRANEFVGDDDTRYDEATRYYRNTLNTAACQLGAVMALTALALRARTTRSDIAALADRFVAGINAALSTGDRRWFLSRDEDVTLHRIAQMNTRRAPYFRYFWLELLATPEGRAALSCDEPDALDGLRDEGRAYYLKYLEGEELRALKRAYPRRPSARLTPNANAAARDNLAEALDHWFGVDEDEFGAWYAEVGDSAESEDEDDDATEDDYEDDEVE